MFGSNALNRPSRRKHFRDPVPSLRSGSRLRARTPAERLDFAYGRDDSLWKVRVRELRAGAGIIWACRMICGWRNNLKGVL